MATQHTPTPLLRLWILWLILLTGLWASLAWFSPIASEPTRSARNEARYILGKYLFFERQLSVSGTKSCGTCHDPNLAFVDRYRRGLGLHAEVLSRNTPTLINVRYYKNFNWANPDLVRLEKQFERPLFNQHPPEMAIERSDTVLQARLNKSEAYRDLFARAFPKDSDPMRWDNALLAMGVYVRTLNSFNSPYDRFKRGEKRAMTTAARRGERLFNSQRLQCATCHPTPYFTDNRHDAETEGYHNIGLYNVGGKGDYPDYDQGLYTFTKKPEDRGRFKTPSLRNVELTPPYMHDGSIETLEEVLTFFEKAGRNVTAGPYAGDGRNNPHKSDKMKPFALTKREREDLLAFLRALTDSTVLRNPDFLRPPDIWEHPPTVGKY